MPAEKPSKLSEWINAIREGYPAARIHLAEWIQACRVEPATLWHTPAIRITVYVLAGILAVKLVGWSIDMMAPGGPEPAPRATTADIHVVCTNSDCGKHFVINRDFGFDDFPVTCPKCRKQSGSQARKCTSKSCRARWVAPQEDGDRLVCPECGTDLGPAP